MKKGVNKPGSSDIHLPGVNRERDNAGTQRLDSSPAKNSAIENFL
jgi:hypothetical protein